MEMVGGEQRGRETGNQRGKDQRRYFAGAP